MKKAVIIFFMSILLVPHSKAQELSLGADVLNRYVWRGLDLGGKSPSIQPWMKINAGNDNHMFSFGAWGAFSTAGTSNEETDLFLSYTFKNAFTATLTDYFFPGLNSGSQDKYFEWGKESTGHVLEGTLSFNGTEKLPITLLFSMNLYGNDARRSNGKIFMSKYIEIGYKTTVKEVGINLFAGAALDKPNINNGETSFYLNQKPGLINLGLKVSKDIRITNNYSLPIQCSLIVNPDQDKIYMVFGFSI